MTQTTTLPTCPDWCTDCFEEVGWGHPDDHCIRHATVFRAPGIEQPIAEVIELVHVTDGLVERGVLLMIDRSAETRGSMWGVEDLKQIAGAVRRATALLERLGGRFEAADR